MSWEVLSWISNFIFGIILVYFFFQKHLERNRSVLMLFSLLSVCIQLCIGIFLGFNIVNRLYPLLVHIPLFFLLILYYKKGAAASLAAILIAYVLTIPRNWFGDLAVFCFPAVPDCKEIAKVIITLPLLVILCKFLSPNIHKMLKSSPRELGLIIIPGLLYYCIAYFTTVYTNLLYSSNIIVTGFILTLFIVVIYIYICILFKQLSKMLTLKQQQRLIELQADETTKRLEEISYSQNKTKIMRHDLRHYFQITDCLLSENKIDEARAYMRTISAEISETAIRQFCANESVNLILSSYDGRASKLGISLSVASDLPAQANESDLDVCIVLANGIENAFHAAVKHEHSWISVECNFFHDKFVIQIRNPYVQKPRFENGLPKSSSREHGIGTASITAIAEKHGGVAEFLAEDGIFTMRVVMN